MLSAIRSHTRKRWRSWINRRIPVDDRRDFDRRCIFILPTAAGWVFGLLLVVMLLTGINYQNSLIYLLTFLLGALFVAAMHQTHNNLSGLQLALLQPGEGFAGDAIPFRFVLQGPHEATAIELGAEAGGPIILSVVGSERIEGTLQIPSRERGFLRPDRVRVETRFPFGLLMAWSWLRPATPALVYPRPVLPPRAPEGSVEAGDSEAVAVSQGQDQVELRPWREGDLSARVDWKRYSRNGEMTVADWEGEQGSPQWLDFEGFPGVDHELRLSYLTALVLDRDRVGEPWGLRLPGVMIEPDRGAHHRRQCLRSLATWQRTPPGGDGGR
ncbi:DUF58 domain-containing protein [Marinobacter sp.]|uniref:DUF58 domain-containing protein n=1 Tax=Marinobacter sp. TaxID=50741 RepID=UPI0035691FF3